jgi:hypothetical protein
VTGKKVAIKKVSNLFCDPECAVKVLRETKLITRLRHDNVRCRFTPPLSFDLGGVGVVNHPLLCLTLPTPHTTPRHRPGSPRAPQILSAVDLQVPASFADFKDVYIVTELMETDMHRVIYSRQRLSEEHVKYFVYQVSTGGSRGWLESVH